MRDERVASTRALSVATLVFTLQLVAACGSGPVVRSSGSGEALTDPGPKAASPDKPSEKNETKAAAPAPTGKASKKPKDEILFDEVLAIVDANVVTRSSVREDTELEVQARIDRLAKGGGRKALPASEIQDIQDQIVRLRIRDILLSDSVDTLGLDPSRIDNIVARILDDRVAEAERAAGGSLEFVERLKERGSSYESYRSELRDEIRRSLSLSEKMREAGATSQLLATPREMRAYYEANVESFTTPRSARLELMRFEPSASTPKSPLERARAARAAILRGVKAAEAVRAAGGRIEEIRPDGGQLALFRNFAFKPENSVGQVSETIERGREVWLMRLAQRSAGGTRPFTDERVQRAIREAIAGKLRKELYLELISDEERRTKIWPESLIR